MHPALRKACEILQSGELGACLPAIG